VTLQKAGQRVSSQAPPVAHQLSADCMSTPHFYVQSHCNQTQHPNFLTCEENYHTHTHTKSLLNLFLGDMTGINMVCWHAAVHRLQFILIMPVYPRGAVPPTVNLAKILCFVDCASPYNLVNKTNLVHNLFLVY